MPCLVRLQPPVDPPQDDCARHLSSPFFLLKGKLSCPCCLCCFTVYDNNIDQFRLSSPPPPPSFWWRCCKLANYLAMVLSSFSCLVGCSFYFIIIENWITRHCTGRRGRAVYCNEVKRENTATAALVCVSCYYYFFNECSRSNRSKRVAWFFELSIIIVGGMSTRGTQMAEGPVGVAPTSWNKEEKEKKTTFYITC